MDCNTNFLVQIVILKILLNLKCCLTAYLVGQIVVVQTAQILDEKNWYKLFVVYISKIPTLNIIIFKQLHIQKFANIRIILITYPHCLLPFAMLH